MIDFSIPADTQLLLDSIKRFVDTELMPLEIEVEAAGEVSPELAKRLRTKALELGFFAMDLPESAGGAGLSALEMCLAEEQFGRVGEALIRHTFGSVPGVLAHCEGEQRKKYLDRAVRGEIDVAIAMTEPGAGSDASGIRTTASRDGDGWVLNGAKHFISGADVAEAFFVTAVTSTDSQSRQISTFLVDRDSPGFTIGRVQPMMGLRGVKQCELFFDQVRLGPDQLLGPQGRGLSLALSTLNRVRLSGLAARAVGSAMRLLDECLQYSKDRHQGGKSISEHQLIQAKLARMAADIYATRNIVLNAAWEVDQGFDPRAKVSIAKLQASEMLGRTADQAVQIFGGAGYSKDSHVERIYRDARVLRILDGTSEIHELIIARSLLKQGISAIA